MCRSMKVKLNLLLRITVISLSLIFLMYQETPAQPKRTTIKGPAQQASVPDISYTVSMSKPWTHLLEVEPPSRPITPRTTCPGSSLASS